MWRPNVPVISGRRKGEGGGGGGERGWSAQGRGGSARLKRTTVTRLDSTRQAAEMRGRCRAERRTSFDVIVGGVGGACRCPCHYDDYSTQPGV